jgi:hypothetical protein
MPEPIVLAKKEGAMSMTSPQLDRVQDTFTEGTAVIIGAGAALNAGTPLSITLSGLPHHSATPRNISLILVGVIVIIGFWATTRPGDAGADRLAERKRLISRREKMLQDPCGSSRITGAARPTEPAMPRGAGTGAGGPPTARSTKTVGPSRRKVGVAA